MEDPPYYGASRMEDPSSYSYKIYVLCSVTAFSLVNYLTRYVLPTCATKTFRQSWKWRNVATSLVHSFVTGVWAPIAFYHAPEMLEDIRNTYSHTTYMLVSVSIGYFIYDSLDMMLYHRKRSTYELMIHHGLVIMCFIIAVSTRQYVAYGGLSLAVEINSVFLHMRQLFIITEESKSSFRYKVNAVLNVATFLVFRIYVFGWMTRWLSINKPDIPFSLFAVATVTLTVIIVMNIILLYRCLSVDLPSFLGIVRKQSSKESVGVSCNGLSNGDNGYIHSYASKIHQNGDIKHRDTGNGWHNGDIKHRDTRNGWHNGDSQNGDIKHRDTRNGWHNGDINNGLQNGDIKHVGTRNGWLNGDIKNGLQNEDIKHGGTRKGWHNGDIKNGLQNGDIGNGCQNGEINNRENGFMNLLIENKNDDAIRLEDNHKKAE